MTSALRRLFAEILAEAERRPDFGRRLVAALAEIPSPTGGGDGPKRKSSNRRARGVRIRLKSTGRVNSTYAKHSPV